MDKNILNKYKLKLQLLGVEIVDYNDWAIKTYKGTGYAEVYGCINTLIPNSYIPEIYDRIELMDDFIVMYDNITYRVITKGNIELEHNDMLSRLMPLGDTDYRVLALISIINKQIILFNCKGNKVILDITDKNIEIAILMTELNRKRDNRATNYELEIDEMPNLKTGESRLDHVKVIFDEDFKNIDIKHDTNNIIRIIKN